MHNDRALLNHLWAHDWAQKQSDPVPGQPRLSLPRADIASPDKEAFLFTVVIRYWHFQILCPLDIPFETSSLDCCWEIQLAASQLCLCFRFLLSIERTIVAQDTKGESSLPFFPLMTRSRFGH